MRNGSLFVLVMLLFAVALAANSDFTQATPGPIAKDQLNGKAVVPATRNTPTYDFIIPPTAIQQTYYDYMPGGYTATPMSIQDNGSAYLTYHYTSSTAGTRRVGYAYIGADGSATVGNLGSTDIREGFSSMALDPETQNPLYAWHSDVDSDGSVEVLFNFDNYASVGCPGFLGTPFVLVDNGNPGGAYNPPYDDDEFIWPVVFVSKAPSYAEDGKHRVYVFCSNATSHTSSGNATENMLIVYADFTADDYSLADWSTLDWHYETIAQMDEWNADQTWIRPIMHTATVSPDGQVAVMGYLIGDGVAATDPHYFLFTSDFAEGDWTEHLIAAQQYVTSPEYNGSLLIDDMTDLAFDFTHGENTVPQWDDHGRLHLPCTFALTGLDDTGEQVYKPAFMSVRDLIWDPTNPDSLQNVDLWPKGANPNDNLPALPWDNNEDGVVDTDGSGNVAYTVDWPVFWYEADAAFNENNQKVAFNPEHGWMAVLWNDGTNSYEYNVGSDEDYAQWASVPEMYIEMSWDHGTHWTDPIQLNSIDTPELAGMIPEYTYLGNKIEDLGTDSEGNYHAKLHLFFLDDNSYGGYAGPTAAGTNVGGNLMYASIDVSSAGTPLDQSNDDNSATASKLVLNQNSPNPFNPTTSIAFSVPQTSHTSLMVYNVKGQLVKTLVNETIQAGDHNVTWNGTDNNGRAVSSGVYFYRLSNATSTSTKKMVMLK